MANQYKTPGVYIVEKDAFPNSVVEVATAVPAFIGHTQTAIYDTPTRISSMAEFHNFFGNAPRRFLTSSQQRRCPPLPR